MSPVFGRLIGPYDTFYGSPDDVNVQPGLRTVALAQWFLTLSMNFHHLGGL